MQMEKQENWTVVSCRERKAALLKLADCLASNEQHTWLEEMEKLDWTYRARANARYTHYVLDRKWPMQKNLHPLYLRHKQSMHWRWVSDEA